MTLCVLTSPFLRLHSLRQHSALVSRLTPLLWRLLIFTNLKNSLFILRAFSIHTCLLVWHYALFMFKHMLLFFSSCWFCSFRFISNLLDMSTTDMFLEIALPTVARCAYPKSEVLEFDVVSLWGEQRANSTFYLQSLLDTQFVNRTYHPIKISSPSGMNTMLRMRDHTWKWRKKRFLFG